MALLAEVRTIVRPLTEGIIIPANGSGLMIYGAAAEVKKVAGDDIEYEAIEVVDQQKTPFKAGDCFKTRPYKLARRGVKWVYHAITTELPRGESDIHTVNKVLYKVFDAVAKDGLKNVAITGLGTGVGNVDRSIVASLMVQIGFNYSDKFTIKIVDKNKSFINEVNKFLNK